VPDQVVFFAKIAERATRKPLSQVLGYRDFYKMRFIVTGDVLDPRPDTELLVDVALQQSATRILDLGTGSGCILLSILDQLEDTQGVGTDLSQPALEVAARNAAAVGVAARATFLCSDWFADVSGSFDLIVSNPPYIAAAEMDDLQPEVRLFEPRNALTDEADGLSAYRLIAAQAPAFLTQGGRLIFEIGPTQGPAVTAMMLNAGLTDVQVIPDLDGRPRVVVGKKS
jgi:release factor glutamine methyltransferase